MKVGDYFRISMPRTESAVIYQAVVVSSDSEWVSASVVYPTRLANQLKSSGVFKLHLNTLNIVVLGNPEDKPVLKAIYG